MKDTGKDQRTQLTYSLLRQAFTDLLKQKPIQRITVKELCQKAGVNRSTFYAHYVTFTICWPSWKRTWWRISREL